MNVVLSRCLSGVADCYRNYFGGQVRGIRVYVDEDAVGDFTESRVLLSGVSGGAHVSCLV